MDESEGNPLTHVAPDWVPLKDAELWLARRFQTPASCLIPDLVTCVRTGEIPHRVPGLRFTDVIPNTIGGTTRPLAVRWDTGGYACVNDWDAAAVNWLNGTVALQRGGTGTIERLPIEVHWLTLEAWARVELPQPSTTGRDDSAMAWMKGYAIAYHENKRKPKREDTIKLCCKEIRVQYRIAETAWEALPAEWKNHPRTPKV